MMKHVGFSFILNVKDGVWLWLRDTEQLVRSSATFTQLLFYESFTLQTALMLLLIILMKASVGPDTKH